MGFPLMRWLFCVIAYADTRGETETEQTPEINRPEPHVEIKGVEISDDDDSSPRGVLEIPVLGPTDSDHTGSSSGSSCISPTQKPVAPAQLRESHGGSQWRSMIESFRKKSIRRFTSTLASYDVSKKSLSRRLLRIRSADDGIDYNGTPIPKPSWRSFDFAELAAATDNFSSGQIKDFPLFFVFQFLSSNIYIFFFLSEKINTLCFSNHPHVKY